MGAYALNVIDDGGYYFLIDRGIHMLAPNILSVVAYSNELNLYIYNKICPNMLAKCVFNPYFKLSIGFG
mgnify:CR=1 FL=1